jgi:hypothetical protein
MEPGIYRGGKSEYNGMWSKHVQLPYDVQMIMFEEGVFDQRQASDDIEFQDIQTEYADVIPR